MRCWPSSERTTNPSSRRKRQDSLSLSPVLFPPKPLRWVSAGVLLGAVIKTSISHFFGTSAWGGIITLGPLWLCRNNPARGCFSRKNGFLRVGALRRRTRCSLLHTVLFWHLYAWGGITTLGALHAVETLDARGSRRRIRRFYAVSEFAPCGQNIPSAGTHATPALNRAHSGSHGETGRVFRVDGDDVSGSGIIDPIGPFQAD